MMESTMFYFRSFKFITTRVMFQRRIRSLRSSFGTE